jgi:P27 family predicted phage terminase small subunit
MGARGPRKKLPQLSKLEGNPGKRPIEEYGIEAQGEPFVPEHLSDDAQGVIEVIRQSMPPKVYSALDTFLLAAFAHAWSVHKVAVLEMNRPDFSWLVPTARGVQANPWIRIVNSQAQLMASLGDRLGLDPKSRAALKLPAAKQQGSKFDGLFGQTGSSRSLNA